MRRGPGRGAGVWDGATAMLSVCCLTLLRCTRCAAPPPPVQKPKELIMQHAGHRRGVSAGRRTALTACTLPAPCAPLHAAPVLSPLSLAPTRSFPLCTRLCRKSLTSSGAPRCRGPSCQCRMTGRMRSRGAARYRCVREGQCGASRGGRGEQEERLCTQNAAPLGVTPASSCTTRTPSLGIGCLPAAVAPQCAAV